MNMREPRCELMTPRGNHGRRRAAMAVFLLVALALGFFSGPAALADPRPGDSTMQGVMAEAFLTEDQPTGDPEAGEDSTNSDIHAEATGCTSTTSDCFQLRSVSGKQLEVGNKYGIGKGRYVRDRNGGNRGGSDWRLMQVQHGKVDEKGKIVGNPGRFKLWTWFETQRCLDTRDVNTDVIMWPCNSSEGNTRQWWHFQLAPDSVMAARGLKPASQETGSNMLFMIRNTADKGRCLTAGNPAIVSTCNPSSSNSRGGDQLFSVSDKALAEKIKQLAVDHQNAKCSVDKSCEVTMRPDTSSGSNPDPILAYGCASIAEGAKEGIVKNGTSTPITYNFVRRVSESQRHHWNFGVTLTIGSGALETAVKNYSVALQAGYGGEWSQDQSEEKSITRSVSPKSYAWEVRGVPQLPSLADVVFNKSEGLSWTLQGTGMFSVNGNERVQPILVFNEAPSSHMPAPGCHTLGAPELGAGEGPQILRGDQHLGQTPPAVGETLSATPGEWQVGPGFDFEYQWLAAGQLITGAKSNTYTVTANDLGSELAVRVTTRRANYIDATASSKPTAKVVPAREPVDGEDPGDGDPGDGDPGDADPVDGDPVDGDPADGTPAELALKTAVSSAPYTPSRPPLFTVQVTLPDGAPSEVPGTVRALQGERELVSKEVTLKGGRTMATLQVPVGALTTGDMSIEIIFSPDDTARFEAVSTARVVKIDPDGAGGSDNVDAPDAPVGVVGVVGVAREN